MDLEVPGNTQPEPQEKPKAKPEDFNTLEETVKQTVYRDVRQIFIRLQVILDYRTNDLKNLEKQLKNYELWGPFIFILIFTITCTLHQGVSEIEQIFSLIMLLILGGNLILILNAKLLKTKITFLQGISLIGYCLFPLNIFSIAITLLYILPGFLKFFMMLVGVAWSFKSSFRMLSIVTE